MAASSAAALQVSAHQSGSLITAESSGRWPAVLWSAEIGAPRRSRTTTIVAGTLASRGGRGVTTTDESGSMAVPAVERKAEPESEQQEQELGSAADTGYRSDVVPSGRPRRILVASLATRMGTTTIAALLGSVLATTRAGSVRALDATPHAGRLADRLLLPPASEHDALAARLEVRTIDPAAVWTAEQTAGDRGRPGCRTHGRGSQRPSRLGRPTGVRALRLGRGGPGRGRPRGRAHRSGPQGARPGRRDGACRPRPARHARRARSISVG